MDRLSPERRSWNMSQIRSKDTRPEIAVRSLLHRIGCRFRLHVKNLPGKPDIMLARYRTVIFVNGCFWHRHKGCKYAYTPKTRIKFWEGKFRQNVERQKHVISQLRALGWRVVIIWECEVEDSSKLERKLTSLIR